MSVRQNVIKSLQALIDKEGSKAAFAARLGVSRSAVTNWTSGLNAPDIEMIAKIAGIYSLPLSDILEGRLESPIPQNENASGWVEVPFYGSIAAGEPIEMIDRGDTYLIPQSIFNDHPNSGVFQAAGNSWNKGGIFDGFYIVVDFDITEPANEHEPFAVSINDACTVKSIQRLENGVKLLPNSYDETIKPIVLDFDEADDMMAKTLGKVVWTFAPFDYGF